MSSNKKSKSGTKRERTPDEPKPPAIDTDAETASDGDEGDERASGEGDVADDEAHREGDEEAQDEHEEPQPEPASAKPRVAVAAAPVAAPAHAAHGHGAAHAAHAPNRKQYLKIFGLLAFLTALEVGIAAVKIGKGFLISALVLLAIAKAGCVAIFFMHLKQETKIMKWTVFFPAAFPALYAVVLIAEGAARALWGSG